MNWYLFFALLVSTTVVSSASTHDGDSPIVEDTGIAIDGIPIDNLSHRELHYLLKDKDMQLIADLDIAELKSKIETKVTAQPGLRKKRWVPLAVGAARVAFTAARALFKGSARGALSRSGTRVTQQYTRPGSYSNAVKDFNRFNVQGQKPINGKYQGMTGTVGKHRVTVRSGSSGGSPTLEIRTPRSGGDFVRKFRYTRPRRNNGGYGNDGYGEHGGSY